MINPEKQFGQSPSQENDQEQVLPISEAVASAAPVTPEAQPYKDPFGLDEESAQLLRQASFGVSIERAEGATPKPDETASQKVESPANNSEQASPDIAEQQRIEEWRKRRAAELGLHPEATREQIIAAYDKQEAERLRLPPGSPIETIRNAQQEEIKLQEARKEQALKSMEGSAANFLAKNMENGVVPAEAVAKLKRLEIERLNLRPDTDWDEIIAGEENEKDKVGRTISPDRALLLDVQDEAKRGEAILKLVEEFSKIKTFRDSLVIHRTKTREGYSDDVAPENHMRYFIAGKKMDILTAFIKSSDKPNFAIDTHVLMLKQVAGKWLYSDQRGIKTPINEPLVQAIAEIRSLLESLRQ